jgi:hypothetical protein
MDNFFIECNKKPPELTVNAHLGVLAIKGRTIPENTF